MCYTSDKGKFATKWFLKWAKRNQLSTDALLDTINKVAAGGSTVNLGGHLHKVRIARNGAGKSGGFRTVLAYRENERFIYIYGFAKNEKDNISSMEMKTLKKLGKDLLGLSTQEIDEAINSGVLVSLED